MSRYDPATGYICSILLSQSFGQHNLIVLLINNLIYKEKDKDIILDSVGSFSISTGKITLLFKYDQFPNKATCKFHVTPPYQIRYQKGNDEKKKKFDATGSAVMKILLEVAISKFRRT